MDPRALLLIEQLDLEPHPEGGYFREVFRSSSFVTAKSSGAQRTAITSIYYLLPASQVGKLHRVTSDEIWHFLEGDPLELHILDPSPGTYRTQVLGPASDEALPIRVVPANFWQAAVPAGAFTLAGCTVGPGFEHEDSMMLTDDAAMKEILQQKFPALVGLL